MYTGPSIMSLASLACRLAVAGALLATGGLGAAAAQPRAEDPVPAATRALQTGKFEEVDTLLRAATGRPALVVRGLAERARGRYAEAERTFAAAAQSQPAGDGALELGLLQLYLGRRAEGTRTLQPVLARANSDGASPAELLRAGRAAQALGAFEEANDFYREAAGRAPNHVGVNTAWGELFLEKYNRPDAGKSFDAALAADPAWIPAQVGRARLVAQEDPPAARKMVAQVLAANPASVPALLLLADMDLDDAKRTEARASLTRALAINPNSLEARALAAAIDYVEGRVEAFDAAVSAILRVNPSYGEVYRVAGDLTARNYRFVEAAALTRKAIALDPDAYGAHAALGMHLLRVGDEPGARRALETAFKGDPYDVVTFNSLALLDTLDTFVTVTDGELVMRFDPAEAAVMREHALPLAKQAMAALSARWGFTPKGPILIEMFPKHDDFAVRTLGLPGMLGALGACFGQVVTLDSPRARKPGTFNWGSTLWHELAHVITLQLSDQRIPRWLTEGISVFEEKRARRDWGREQELEFADALNRGKVLTLKTLNSGFSDPRTISLAYFEASVLVEHIIERFGEARLKALVQSFATGIDTEAALPKVLGVDIDDLQVSFDAFVDRNFRALRAAMTTPPLPEHPSLDELKALATTHPGSFPLQMQLGQALRKAGDAAGALAAFGRAAALAPSAAGESSPHVLMAAVAEELKQPEVAIAALEALALVDHVDVESARKLAALVAPLGDAKRTAAAYDRIVGIDPFDADAGAKLGDYSLKAGDAVTAIRAYRGVLAAGSLDKAGTHAGLAEAYWLTGQRAEAKVQALAALEIAPGFERAQDLLLKLLEPTSSTAPPPAQ